MKPRPPSFFRFAMIPCLGLSAVVPATARAAIPAATIPYNFVGRVMDARHAGFDDKRVCTLSAADAESGEILVTAKTTHIEGSRRNYVLRIPVATAAADGHAIQGATLAISAVDDLGKTWTGLVADPLCGPSGGVREVDIVLGTDKNGDGIPDELYAELEDEWAIGGYASSGDEFDPMADHDGDGVPTLHEAYSGTDPFDPDDTLRITGFSAAGAGEGTANGAADPAGGWALTFPAVPGRAYAVVGEADLSARAWAPVPFAAEPGSGAASTVVVLPSSAKPGPVTVYLLPSDAPAAFFRVRVE